MDAVWNAALITAGAGTIGGIANCMSKDFVFWPRFDRSRGVWHPGWVGTLFTGAIAALATWGTYGPMSTVNLLGDGSDNAHPSLLVAQLITSVLVGYSGSHILTLLADNQAKSLVNKNLQQALANLQATVDAGDETDTDIKQ